MSSDGKINEKYYVNVAELMETDIDIISESIKELPIIKEGYRKC